MSKQYKVPLNLAKLATDPVSATVSDIYFNTTNSVIRVYTSTGWQNIGGAAGGGTTNHTHDYNGNVIVGDGSTLVAVATFGSGAPSNQNGLNGDIYIDTQNMNIYTKSADTWTLQASFNTYTKGQVDNLISVLNGLTATTTELNYVHGVTSSIQTQIDSKVNSSDLNELAQDAVGNNLGTGLSYNDTTGTISVNTSTIQARVSGVSDTEIGYLDGVTSAIQTQIDSKLASSTAASTYAPIDSPTFTGTVSGVTKSMVGLGNVDNTSDANKPISTATQTALDGKSNTGHTHTISNVTDITATAAELNILDGVIATTTEINYLHGVTDNIQDQFNNIGNSFGDYIPLNKIGVADGVAQINANSQILALSGGIKFSDNTVQTTAVNTSTFASRSQLSDVEVLALAGL